MFPNWNIAADTEPKIMFQVVVVSKTRVPSVDDELRINDLGTIKYILLKICKIKHNCPTIPTETDSKVTKYLNYGKIPLYR